MTPSEQEAKSELQNMLDVDTQCSAWAMDYKRRQALQLALSVFDERDRLRKTVDDMEERAGYFQKKADALQAKLSELEKGMMGEGEIRNILRQAHKDYEILCGEWKESNPKPMSMDAFLARALSNKIPKMEIQEQLITCPECEHTWTIGILGTKQ